MRPSTRWPGWLIVVFVGVELLWLFSVLGGQHTAQPLAAASAQQQYPIGPTPSPTAVTPPPDPYPYPYPYPQPPPVPSPYPYPYPYPYPNPYPYPEPPVAYPEPYPYPYPSPVPPTVAPAPASRVVVGLSAQEQARSVLLRITIHSDGVSGVRDVRGTLSYPAQRMQVTDVRFDRASAWVSSNEAGQLEFRTGSMQANDQIVALVQATLLSDGYPGPDQRPFSVEVRYSWADRGSGGSGRSNQVQIGGSAPIVTPPIMIAVDPVIARVGARIQATSSAGFFPGEPVAVWLNTPMGVRAVGRVSADVNGIASSAIATDNLRPGDYQVVFFGIYSEQIGVGGFYLIPAQ